MNIQPKGGEMDRQHTENLFRRYKGQLVNLRTVSGGVYKGHVTEITGDYVALTDRETDDETKTYILFDAIESLVVLETSSIM
jgi:phenolic acid decarboxylase